MAKEIYIKLTDGDKSSEIRMAQIDEQHQLSMLDGFFKFFNIDVDFREMADIYQKSGKAYQKFFEEIEQTEERRSTKEYFKPNNKTLEHVSPESEYSVQEHQKRVEENNGTWSIKELTEDKKEIHTPKLTRNEPDFFVTGIKYKDDKPDQPLYKCRYKCKCGSESNHYIPKGYRRVNCYECGMTLKVKPATAHGDPQEGNNPDLYRDRYGNFYVGGLFEQDVTTMADLQEEKNES